ncbi:MAG: DUF2442 domain-containing protein [Rhodospirillales bacterium]|nr:DUF2442 domain-containing protein [Rhodospirillales bacterium]
MARAKPRQIAAVRPRAKRRLDLVWADGGDDRVDLSALITAHAKLAPLRETARFQKAQVGDYGWTIDWGRGLEIDATHLFRLARLQAGDTLAPQDFRVWRRRLGLSQTGAAKALGISGRMVKYYEEGGHMIPRTVMLACRGYEAIRKTAKAGKAAA